MELIDTWESFGMTYRGRWNPTNTYNEKDVVWIDLVSSPKLGSETYFICQKTHLADNIINLNDVNLWIKYR